MWTTLASLTSVPSASQTARLRRRTCCEPPKTKSTGVCGSSSSAARAAALSRPANERIGVPVTKHCPGSRAHVSAKDTASALASRADARTLRPGTRLPSHITLGMRNVAAALTTGMAM